MANWCDKWKNNDKTSAAVNGPLTFDSDTGTVHAQERAVTPKFTITTPKATSRTTTQRNLSDWLSYDTKKASNRLTGLNSKLKSLTSSSVGVSAFGAGGGNTMHKTSKERKDLQAQIKALTAEINTAKQYQAEAEAVKNEDRLLKYNVDDAQKRLTEMKNRYSASYRAADNVRALGATPNVSREQKQLQSQIKELSDELERAKSVQYSKKGSDTLDKLKTDSLAAWGAVDVLASDNAVDDTRALGAYSGVANRNTNQARMKLKAMGYEDKDIEQLVDYRKRQRNKERYEAAIQRAQETANDGFGGAVAASADSVARRLWSGLGTVDIALQHLRKDDRPIDYYTGSMALAAVADAERAQVSQNIIDSVDNTGLGESLAFLYQTGMSMADSAVTMLAAGAMGAAAGAGATATKAAKMAGLMLMGGGASTTAITAAKERGLSDKQALALGLCAGAAEVITEKIGVDQFLNTISTGSKRALVEIGKNALAEGSEEVGSEFLNLFADIAVSGDKSEWKKSIHAYKELGYDDNEALSLAVADKAKEIGVSFLGGALSGGVFGTAGVAINRLQNNDLRVKVAAATMMDEDTQSYRIAQQIQELVTAEVPQETTDNLLAVLTDSLDKHMHSELSAEERKSIMQKARAVVRADKQDRKTVQKATNQVAKMMAENAGAVRSADESTAEDVQSQTPARSYATTQIATAVGSVVSTGRPLSDKLTNEIIADRASVEALGLEYGGKKTLANMTATQSRAAVRKAVQEHKAQVEAETAAETTEAPAAEQTAQTETAPEQEGFTSYEQFSKEFREDEHFKDYSEEEMQRMYQLTKEWNKRRESKVFLSDIGRVVSLSEFRQFAKQAEKQDSTEYTEEEILGAFDSAVESTKADVERHEADRKANLDTMAQNIKSAFEARKLGIDVEVVYGENEYFQAKGTRENAVVVGNKIVFNGNVINSGEAMLYVLGHELVHPGARVDKGLVDTIIKTFQYLADNGIIKGKLAKRVKNIEDTIESTRELYQQHENELAAKENREAVEQTTDKVREEVAADLMREAFASTEICKEIVGYNPGLANKVKDAIRRVKNAITGADGKLNPEAQQKLDDLNKQFDDALKLVAEKNSRFNDDNVEGKVDSGAEPGVPNPSQPQFSLSTWEQPNYKSQFSGAGFSRSLAKDGDSYVFRTGHDVLSDLLDKEGVDANVADRVLTWMDGMADFMRNAGVKYQFINLAEVNNAKVSVRYDTDGKPLSIALSAMVKNGEYPVNFDLTQICKRREAMSKFVNKLLDEHQFSEFSLSKANLLEIVKILRDEGYDTACTGCFVESKRYYMEDFTKRFVKKWNDAVKKINPNAEYFNFADANREITREEIEAADEAMESFRTANKETSAAKTESLEDVVSRIHESGLSEEDIEAIRENNRAGHEAVDADLAAGKQAKFNYNKYVADKTLKKYTEPRMVTGTELKYLIKRGVFGGKKANNAEQIENLVKSDPVFQRLLTPADIMTTSGLTQFTQLSDTLVSLLSGSYGSGAPKLAQGFIPYNNEIAFLPDKVGKINLSEYLQGIAGLRSQSFSDFKIENVFDYFQMAAELTARHLPAHMYTKELACAKILGMLGVKVNMSVMFNIEGDEYWGSEAEARKYAGLIRDKDGNITYNYADKANSDRVFEETGKRPFIQSIDVAGAFELQDDPRYSKNIGVIGVGYSDEHIRMMLNDPRFRYIIPYHRSSLPVEISNGTNLNRATNYTSTQNTLSFKVLKPDGKGVSMRGKSFKSSAEFLSWVEENGYTLETKKAQAGHGEFDLYGDLEKTNDPKQTAENYKAWCWEHGYLPLFYQFSSEENYYKLLYDFAVYDHEGNYAPQGAVQMWNEDGEMTGFPDDITDVVETEMKAQNSVNEELWNPEKVEHVVDTIYNTVKLDKGPGQFSLSEADTEYMELAKNPEANRERLQQMVDEAAVAAGYNIKVYHGTANGGHFTKFDAAKLNNSKLSSHIGQGFYFTNDAKAAKEYTSNFDIYGRRSKGKNPHLFQGYLKLTNPIEITENSHKLSVETIRDIVAAGDNTWFFESGLAHDLQNKEISGARYTNDDILAMSLPQRLTLFANYLYQSGDMAALQGMVDAYKFDNQGLLLKAMQTYTGGDGVVWNMRDGLTQYVAFGATQFKESDPVTYDDNGNVIPLSKRFNTKNNDIRYSIGYLNTENPSTLNNLFEAQDMLVDASLDFNDSIFTDGKNRPLTDAEFKRWKEEVFPEVNEKIFKKTNWWFDYTDSVWRYWISDKDAGWTVPENADIGGGEVVDITDIFTHEKLFNDYPALRNIQVVFALPDEGSIQGSFDANRWEITLKQNPKFDEATRAAMIHELNHAVQAVEQQHWNSVQGGSNTDIGYKQAFVEAYHALNGDTEGINGLDYHDNVNIVEEMIADLYRRKGLSNYESKRYVSDGMTPTEVAEWSAEEKKSRSRMTNADAVMQSAYDYYSEAIGEIDARTAAANAVIEHSPSLAVSAADLVLNNVISDRSRNGLDTRRGTQNDIEQDLREFNRIQKKLGWDGKAENLYSSNYELSESRAQYSSQELNTTEALDEGASSVSDIRFSLGTVNGEAMAIVDSINAPATVTDAEAYLQAIANNPEVFATTLDGATEVYLGQDLPGEYTWSFDTRRAGYFDKRAKMQASTVLKDMIYLGENGRWKANAKEKHAIDAANGWTRFDVKFAVPGLNDTYKVYTGYAVIRNDADGKSYLYDVVNVKYKETLPSDRVVLNRNDSNNTPAMRDKTAPLTGDSVAQDNGEVNKNFSLSSVAVNSNQFKNADSLNPTAGPDIRYSLSPVDPVQPSTTEWNRTKTTGEALAAFPNMWNVSAEESETRNPTQIKATVGTYRKIFNILKDEGFNGTILDASSGLGVGTEAGRNEFGFDVDDIEPYPDSGYTPKYTDYSKLNKKYDVIISSAVLNVLPQDQRDALVSKMGQLLNDGGRMFITTRGTDVESLAKTGKNIHLGNMEWIETVKGSYQKGFTNSELIAYLQDALGDGFTVVPASKETGGKFNNNTNVVVTKRASESMSRYSVEDDELKSFLDAYDEAFGEGASKADFTNLNQQLRAARRARRTAEMAEESKQAKISLSNRGRLATERAWEIYHKRTVRTVRNEYRAKLEQSRKDKIAAVKQAVVVERAKAEVKLEEQELAERMNAKKQAAKRLGLKDEQIQQMKNKSKEKSQLQRNASRNTLKNKRLADKKRAAIETEQGPISTIRENPQQRTFTEKLQSSAENLRTKGRSLYKNFVNKAMHIDRVAKRQTSHMNASVLASIVSSCNSTVSDIYTKGLTDRQGNMVGKSMKEVFLCLDEKGNIDYDKQALFQDYALHLHNVDRMSFVAKARAKLEAFEAANSWLAEMDKNEFARLTAMTEAELEKTGKQQAHDLAVQYSQLLQEYSEAADKPVFPDKNGNPITAETSRQVVAKYEAENPWLKEKAQEMYDWWDQFMKIWVVGDSITQEQYDTMREMYPHYVPTYRVDGKGLSGAVSIGAKGARPGQVVKSAKGGLGEIVNIEDSFANLAAKAVKSARVNELYKNLVDTAMLDDAGVFEDYMLFDWDSVEQGASYATQTGEVVSVYGNSFDVGESVDAAEAPGLVKTKDGYKVSAWYNGRLLSTYVSEDLFISLQETTGAVKDKLDKVAKVGSVLTNPMKTAITGVNPNFALRNTLRDFPTAVINSVSGLAFPKYWARAWKEIYRSDAWHNFVALGGTNSLYYNTEGGFGKAMNVERGAAGTVKKVWNGTKNVMGFLNETTESVTRFAEYLATIDRMGDTYENRLIGIKNAAEVTVDFSRKGSYGAAINAWVPYWNPAVQGIDKVFRSVFEAPNGKKAFAHGMATLGRAVMTTVLLEAIQQIILAALGRRDDWEELNDRTKDTYYCIPTKDHKFIKIPKNREWGAILGTPLMRLFEGFTGKDDPFENFLETSIIPNFLPGGPTDLIGLSQYIDIATNKDFAGRSIVPYAYTQGSLAGQYDDKTSEMAKLFSKLLGEKLGPMQVDYIIQDYFGDFGDIATMLTAKSTWGEDESVKGILESLWKTVESPWVTDNRYSNADVSVYYENIDELERTWNDKKNHGDGESYKDSIEYKTFQAVVYKSYGKEISEINKQIKDLPDGEKKDELKGQIAKLAGQANEFIDKCLSGDIEAPDLVFEYENLPVQVSDELIRLRSLSDEYSFNPSPSSSKSYVDPTSKVGNKAATREYVLDDEAKAQYNSIYEDTYSKTMQATINSYEYRKANDTHKAEMLEDARDTVAPAVKEEFMLWLQRNRKPTQRKK